MQSDKELIKLLRKLAKVGWGTGTGLMLEAAADRLAILAQGAAEDDRIVQLQRERHTILHLWYKGKEACAVCAHKCTNVEAESCGECKRECLCRACKGENWEEANSDG